MPLVSNLKAQCHCFCVYFVLVNIYQRKQDRGVCLFSNLKAWLIYCKHHSLHNSSIPLLSNNISLLSLNLLSIHWGPWWCVLCYGIRRDPLELYIALLYTVLLRVCEEKHLRKVIKCNSVFLEEAAAWCVLDTVETEVSLSEFREDQSWSGLSSSAESSFSVSREIFFKHLLTQITTHIVTVKEKLSFICLLLPGLWLLL